MIPVRERPSLVSAHGASGAVCWSAAISAPEFLSDCDSEVVFLEPRHLAPGVVTKWFSPRGLGKTNVAHAIAVRQASQGRRVLLIDRDNSRAEVQRRLRNWGAAAHINLKVITREDAPPLTDGAAWAAFPHGAYDVLIVDSLDAMTEGVGEQDSAKPSRALAALLDIARRADGPAVLVLGNTVKSGTHSRGSGVIEDRADIVYEVRDATGFQPSGRRPWIEELPPAGAASWAERATRRQQRDRYRLAYIPTKFRLAGDPAPFILELDFTDDPWSLRDVTDEVDRVGAESRKAREKEELERIISAVAKLTETARTRTLGGAPLRKGEAEKLVMEGRCGRRVARDLLERLDGKAWRLEVIVDQPGQPTVLLPIAGAPVGSDGGGNHGDGAKPDPVGIWRSAILAAQAGKARQKSEPRKGLLDNGFSGGGVSAAAPPGFSPQVHSRPLAESSKGDDDEVTV